MRNQAPRSPGTELQVLHAEITRLRNENSELAKRCVAQGHRLITDEMVKAGAKAAAEAAGFCWDNCAQSQWERDMRAGLQAALGTAGAVDHAGRTEYQRGYTAGVTAANDAHDLERERHPAALDSATVEADSDGNSKACCKAHGMLIPCPICAHFAPSSTTVETVLRKALNEIERMGRTAPPGLAAQLGNIAHAALVEAGASNSVPSTDSAEKEEFDRHYCEGGYYIGSHICKTCKCPSRVSQTDGVKS